MANTNEITNLLKDTNNIIRELLHKFYEILVNTLSPSNRVKTPDFGATKSGLLFQ